MSLFTYLLFSLKTVKHVSENKSRGIEKIKGLWTEYVLIHAHDLINVQY